MTFRETNGNILELNKDTYIAHAISGDCALGAGLAKAINEKYDMVRRLQHNLYRQYGLEDNDSYCAGEAVLIGKVFNLVVKDRCRDTVEYDDLYSALEDMREQCEIHEIEEVAMPRICCGREKMNWDDVKEIIIQVFDDTNINIIVYNMETREVEPVKDERKLLLYDNLLEYVVDNIPDDEDVYNTLLEIGFTPDEIHYEGYDE